MQRATRKTTIYDLAALTGASASTVSASLSGTWRARRISEDTALRIQRVAAEAGYTINLQARGLRSARSGLIGMILPAHFNRFFSSLSQIFEAHARARGLCPVLVSTLRDPDEERRTVGKLISHAIEALFVVGATNPDRVSELCSAAGLPHVNIDLPGARAPSVVSDNDAGAEALTHALIDAMRPRGDPAPARPYFIGGARWDYASAERIAAFERVVAARVGPIGPGQILADSYEPDASARDMAALHARLGGLPAALFVNSTFAFEGVLKFFATLPADAFGDIVVGCYDYDPFASFMHIPVIMVRQNVEELIAGAFRLLDSGATGPMIVKVAPELVPPRTIRTSPIETLTRPLT
jgi:LacI family fructose operon transcriptional repressor